MAVMIARGELALEVELESDTAPVHELAASLLELGDAVRWLRDPTRGGLATALNELAAAGGARGRARGSGAAATARGRREPARFSASTRSTSRTRASWSRSSRRTPPRRRSPGCERTRSARRRRSSARCGASPRASCSWTPPSAAAGSSTCSSATRCRGSANGSTRSRFGIEQDVVPVLDLDHAPATRAGAQLRCA